MCPVDSNLTTCIVRIIARAQDGSVIHDRTIANVQCKIWHRDVTWEVPNDCTSCMVDCIVRAWNLRVIRCGHLIWDIDPVAASRI